jgi:sortase A
MIAGAGLLAHGWYLPAKASLAQVLLRRAWAATGSQPVRPWPWADTWPVARLLVPRLGVDQIVLAGTEGAALAFAPGHVDSGAAPGDAGNIAIAGHRDTVFSYLGDLRIGDLLWLECADGTRRSYTVDQTAVVHERETSVLDPTAMPTLTLVTCYPLDARRPGGPLRYVVRATARGNGRQDAAGRQMKSRISGQISSIGRFGPRQTATEMRDSSAHSLRDTATSSTSLKNSSNRSRDTPVAITTASASIDGGPHIQKLLWVLNAGGRS